MKSISIDFIMYYGQRKVAKLKIKLKNKGTKVTDAVRNLCPHVLFGHIGTAEHCGILGTQ